MRVAPGAQPAPQQQSQGQPPEQGGGGQPQGPNPEQIIQMIQGGFQALGKLLQSAGQNLPPEDIKLFQAAAQATDAMIQSLTGPAQGEQGEQGKQPPSQPMPQNANAQSGPQG